MNLANCTPAFVNVTGKTKSERQMSVVLNASGQVLTALSAAKGKVGKFAREETAKLGLGHVARAAAWPTCNYKPAAEYFAARLGEPMVISSRATFEALEDMMSARVAQAKLGKNGGMVECKKTFVLKDGAKLALARELTVIARELVEVAAEMSAEHKSKHDAARAESAAQAAITSAQQATVTA